MFSRLLSLSLLASLVACDEKEPASDSGVDFGYDCTEIGCTDGLQGEFQPELKTQGTYVFTLDLDGAVSTCSLTLPIVDSESCTGALQITRSGSALADSEHSLPSFRIDEIGFTSYTLTAELDGTELFSVTEEPDWELVHPNGEECGPTCEIASTTVAVP